MKVRKGFVSNSSTTTFICEICGSVYAERDAGLQDAEMIACSEGHTFCERHTDLADPDSNKKLEILKEALSPEEFNSVVKDDEGQVSDEDWHEHYDYEIRSEMPITFCPICTMETIRDKDIQNYLMKKSGLNKIEIETEMKDKFKTHEAFEDYVKEEG